ELDAQLRGHVDAPLRARRVVRVGDRSQHDAFGTAAGLDHLRGDGGALRLEAREADVVLLEGEAEAEALAGELEDANSGGGDLGTDAVAGQNHDVHCESPGKVRRRREPERNAL